MSVVVAEYDGSLIHSCLALPLFAPPSLTLIFRVAGLMLCLADTPARAAAVVSSLLVLLRMVTSGE